VVDEWSHIEDSALAQAALHTSIAAQHFALVRTVRYTLRLYPAVRYTPRSHFASVDAWLE
jgi:hypothetical protein